MVEVRKNAPPPAPPETYDLLGLSLEQAELIRDLAGRISVSDNKITGHNELYNKLQDILPEDFPVFDLHQNGGGWGPDTKIGVFRVRRRG